MPVFALAAADPTVLADESRLVDRFLAWLPQAAAPERAAAVNALARAYLHCDLAPMVRVQVEKAMTASLDDPDTHMRRGLAEALASARAAPRHIVLALAADSSDIARVVLTRSPLLSDADLVNAATTGDAAAQTAVARRPMLAATVSTALAEVGDRAAILALIANFEAEIPRNALWRLFERYSDDPDARARLSERPNLPSALRAAIAAATTDALAGFATSSAWLEPRRAERIARDGREQAFIAIAADGSESDLAELVQWLRAGEHLTVSLLLRALVGADTRLFRHSLADMASLAPNRAEGLLRDPRGSSFAALYRKAGMSAHLLPVFRVAFELAQRSARANGGADHLLATNILRAIEALQDVALAPTIALLGRLASESARDDARNVAAVAQTPAEIAPLEIALLSAEASAPPVLMLNFEPGNENATPTILLDEPPLIALPVAA
jgi:uncharacterized protein (DUF2336 family)